MSIKWTPPSEEELARRKPAAPKPAPKPKPAKKGK